MPVLVDHQITLIALAFLAGIAGALMLFLRDAPARVWKLADLGWVVLGGFGAIAAVIAGIWKADSSRLARQIDVAYAATRLIGRDAARFRLVYCAAPEGPALTLLCGRIDDIAAATAADSGLPLFLDVARIVAPLQDLTLFRPADARPGDGPAPDAAAGTARITAAMTHDQMVGMVETFRPAELPAGGGVAAALAALPPGAPAAADYQLIADGYAEVIAQVRALRHEWDYLQAHRTLLSLQIAAIAMVAFAAPFRLGKSLVDLGRPGA